MPVSMTDSCILLMRPGCRLTKVGLEQGPVKGMQLSVNRSLAGVLQLERVQVTT